MSDDEGRDGVKDGGTKRLLDSSVRGVVEVGGGLVEEEDGGVLELEETSSEGEELSLAGTV
jgi:hypothetical protein